MEYNPKEKIKIVVTRSVKSKTSEESKLEKFSPGDEVEMARKYADELISIRKAVLPNSAAHKAWIEQEKGKLAQKMASQKPTKAELELEEAKKKIAELEEKLSESSKPSKK